LIALEKLEKSDPEVCTHTRSLIKSDITQEELQEIKKTLEETNAIQEAFNYSNKFINDAKESLEAFSNTEIKNCLLELLEYSLVRKF
jgi:geranylgeranyl pyrophosphate synthase